MSFNPAGLGTYTLQSSISSTQTTITLSSFKVPVTGADVTMALMNTDIAYGTIAPKTSSSEFISFTGITQNANGTATLTGVTRGLNKTYPLTEDTDFKLPHAGQSVFIISDVPQLFNSYAALDNDNIFTGYNEVPDPLDDADIANKGYVDALVNGGTVSNNRIVVAGVAGETISSGNSVYLSTSDGRWYKTDADTAATVYGVTLGIAQGAGTTGNNITGGVLTEGTDTLNTGTAGNTAYVGNTAGALSTSAGTNTRAVGVYLPALAGLYYNPNLFLKYPQNTQSVYAVDSVGTDSYAITLTPAPGSYVDGMTVTFKAGTANTGAATLNVNALGAKTIYKYKSYDLVTGDIVANQDITVIYDGTNFQLQTPTVAKTPVVNVYTTVATALGSSTTRFDIVNTVGSTYRYTFDGTGTDPNFSAVNNPIGSLVYFRAENFNAANNGLFLVTGSGANYVEVTNASGVAENDKTIGTGTLQRQTAANGTWTKPAGLTYITIEQVGGGGDGGAAAVTSSGAGGGSAGYNKKMIAASSLGSVEYFIVPPKLCPSVFGLSSTLVSNQGTSAVTTQYGVGGTATGGDLIINGQNGTGGDNNESMFGSPGASTPLGVGGGGSSATIIVDGSAGTGYGSGGGGGGNTTGIGGAGRQGVIILTEYYN